MQEIIAAIEAWHSHNEALALATVVRVYGSAPRSAGAKLLVSSRGAMVGSVSGGCVEAAVVATALRAIKTGQHTLSTFGISDEQAWEAGLACGGTIDIMVEPLSSAAATLLTTTVRAAIAEEREWALALVIDGPLAGTRWLIDLAHNTLPAAVPPDLARHVLEDARILLTTEHSTIGTYAVNAEAVTVFIETHLPAPHLVVVGGVHIATVLCACAKQLGFHVTIVDPRTAFASRERFPQADAVLHEWPDAAFTHLRLDRGTYIAVLTHDPKLDDPAIIQALQHPVRYIGVLGSRKTQEERRQRLQAQGLTATDLARLHAPIGLPLGANTPAEIAISILAEIVAVKHNQRV